MFRRCKRTRTGLFYLLSSVTTSRIVPQSFFAASAFPHPNVIIASSSAANLYRDLFSSRGSSSSSSSRSMSEGLADIGRTTSDKNDNKNTTDNQSSSASSSSSSSSWRELLEASSNRCRKIRGSNYVQLATVDRLGRPRCRTVVFRGFLSNNIPLDHDLAAHTCSNMSTVMKMITDARSNKVQEIATSKDKDGQAEMVWWFPKTSEQYRIQGSLVFVGPMDEDTFLQAMRKETWGNLSDAAREAFYDTCAPGQAWNHNAAAAAQAQVPTGGRDATTGKVLQPPPDCYLLMLLLPTACDYLRLGAPQQFRQVDQRHDNGTWTRLRVNP